MQWLIVLAMSTQNVHPANPSICAGNQRALSIFTLCAASSRGSTQCGACSYLQLCRQWQVFVLAMCWQYNSAICPTRRVLMTLPPFQLPGTVFGVPSFPSHLSCRVSDNKKMTGLVCIILIKCTTMITKPRIHQSSHAQCHTPLTHKVHNYVHFMSERSVTLSVT
jgi:hypothetical protein